MSEPKAKTVSVRIYESTLEKLENKKKTFGPKMKDWPDYKDLIGPAVDQYLADGTSRSKGLQANHQASQQNASLLQSPGGFTLTNKQLALYRDLMGKVAEVIARGNAALVAILTQGIEWAHRDLRPEHQSEASTGGKPVIPKARAGGGNPK